MRMAYQGRLGEAAAAQAATPQGPYEECGKYVFRIALAAQGAAGDHFTDLVQFIDKDSDFILTDVAAASDGNFSVNFKNPGNRLLFSSEAQAANVTGTGQFPLPIVPALRYNAGGKIGLSISNLSNAVNNVEIVFSGIKIYATP